MTEVILYPTDPISFKVIDYERGGKETRFFDGIYKEYSAYGSISCFCAFCVEDEVKEAKKRLLDAFLDEERQEYRKARETLLKARKSLSRAIALVRNKQGTLI